MSEDFRAARAVVGLTLAALATAFASEAQGGDRAMTTETPPEGAPSGMTGAQNQLQKGES